MNKSWYRCCAVPMCESTSINTPQKLFINIPKNSEIRKKWLTLARRDPTSLTPSSTANFCEDHFDLQNDMENYIKYTTMGVVSRIKMRPGCLPTKFACQSNRGSTFTNVCQSAAAESSHHEDVKNFQPAEIKIEVCEQFINEEEVHERKEFYDNFDEKKVKIEPTCCTES